ncbi:MAG: DUF1579 domain-containing protein [Acidobacteria bacterium]|nr:DUF1579 domain-containing protein [Acidobacteriota bacterium]
MKKALIALSVLLVFCCALVAQQQGQQAPPTPEQMDAMMKDYMAKYGTPGEHHDHLKAMAGRWSTITRFWPAPGAPPQESRGMAKHRMVLGGRYLETSYKGEFFGSPFAGTGHSAYDRYKNKYVESWVDSMSTMLLVGEGSCSNGGKTRTVTSAYDDPLTAQPTVMRSVYTIRDADHYTLEMFTKQGQQPEYKMMEIQHTRVKAKKPAAKPAA